MSVMALCSWCFSYLAASAVTSVGTANENSQEHDRDDHAAAYVCKRELHAYETIGVVSSPGTSFDTRSAFISDPWNDVDCQIIWRAERQT